MKNPIDKLYIYEISGEYKRENFISGAGAGFLGCWNEPGYSYLFYSRPARGLIDRIVLMYKNLKFMSETVMDYDQWEPADAMKAFTIPPLTFVPAWADGEYSSTTLRLDPGVVFGTGTHNTTRMCLEFLIALMDDERIEKVIDIGTGSGILAVAAARLGAAEVIALDNNNLAVETAVRNAALNNLSDRVTGIIGEASRFMDSKADLIIMNLVTWVLIGLFSPDARLRSRWYIVSGINGSEISDFTGRIGAMPLRIIRKETDDRWTTLLLENIMMKME